ncbi:MAG: hypothetical protein ACYTG4_12585, partial [Planctomycetota bacterium]
TAMERTLKVELGLSTDVPPIRSALGTFKAVHDAIGEVRENIEYCLVVDETYDQRMPKMTVLLSEPDHVDVLKGALESIKDGEDKLFSKGVKYGTVTKGRDGKYRVTFDMNF